MRYPINLSSKPFHNRKLFWFSFLVVIAIAGFWATLTIKELSKNRQEIGLLETKIATQKQKFKGLEDQTGQGAVSLSEDQVQQLQAAASLIKRRSFSWTAMLEEFERALPAKIRIASITLKDKVTSNREGIELGVKIFAGSSEEVTKMIAEMDKRNVFQVQLKSQSGLQEGDIGFDLQVIYKPQPQRLRPPAKKDRTERNDEFAKTEEEED
ncbi:MAG: hypothetical protein AB1489_04200 [Acidobacteriota bacterium]